MGPSDGGMNVLRGMSPNSTECLNASQTAALGEERASAFVRASGGLSMQATSSSFVDSRPGCSSVEFCIVVSFQNSTP